jgi:hypothetical protein
MKFHPKCLWLHCKDHLKWLNNLFYRILVTCFLCKIFNFVSYANVTGVTLTSHNDILKTQYFTLIKYVYKGLITSHEINTYTRAIFKFFRYVFVKKTILFWKLMWCDVMWCDVMWCHTGDVCIWNKVEYLEKGASYQNSIK